MCTYVWEHLKLGYMQGMCDLVAPLLVIFDDESVTYSCFCLLMERMGANFPHKGGAMDTHFANMRSLIQIMDSEMFELMHQNGDYTHFYFCYRWFLLDFKRELLYEDVFSVWETIWAAKHISSAHFMLFIALALVESYRDIILSNSMDFTDIIKFFNEMAERHNAKAILSLARYLVLQLQMLIENK
uniref:Rab-GAP TBC domain-containing protein n=1 Tax=Graphocephala atropunctata TaxID=36148 RepID=A0A1B6LYB2_9HEMI